MRERDSFFAGGVDGDETSALLRSTHLLGKHQTNVTSPIVMRYLEVSWPRTNSPGICTARMGGTRTNGLCTAVVSWNVASVDKNHKIAVEQIEQNNKESIKVEFESQVLAQQHKHKADTCEGNFPTQVQGTKLEHKIQQIVAQKSNTEHSNNCSCHGCMRPIYNIKYVCVCVCGSRISGQLNSVVCDQPTQRHATAEGEARDRGMPSNLPATRRRRSSKTCSKREKEKEREVGKKGPSLPS